MSGHTIHIVDFDPQNYSGRLKLECHCGKGDACHRLIVEDYKGNELNDGEIDIDHCNAVEWFDLVGGELIYGELKGNSPWKVDIEWTEDGPQIMQVEE